MEEKRLYARRLGKTKTLDPVTVTFEELRVAGDEASVRILGTGDGPFDLWFQVVGAEPRLPTEALAAIALPVAMAQGTPIDLGGMRLDPDFAAGVDTWQEVFSSWYPDRLRQIPLRGAKPRRARSKGRGVGCFFTGGIDSFHSMLATRDQLTHLVFVHGFDVPLEGLPALRAEVTVELRRAAHGIGLPLIEVETNLHDFSDTRQSPWGTTYHGAALAAIAHVLGDTFAEVVIGSTHAYADLFPYGSHRLTDPALSSSAVRLVHHGCEADRVEKTIACAASDVAMRHLRVCWENRDGSYNCGTCKKCIRTMVALRIAGALERCETLPDTLDLDAVRALPLGDLNTWARHAELIRHLRERGGEPELLAACEDAVRNAGPDDMRWGERDWTSILTLLFEGR